MPKAKITMSPTELGNQFETFFTELFDEVGINSIVFNEPINLEYDEESDTKIYVHQLFRNEDDPTNPGKQNIYLLYYDGCGCFDMIDNPHKRYQVVPIQGASLKHLWIIYSHYNSNH